MDYIDVLVGLTVTFIVAAILAFLIFFPPWVFYAAAHNRDLAQHWYEGLAK